MNDDADTDGTNPADALHPGAPGWQQAVNEHYALLVPTLDRLDPDERDIFDADYARKAKVLPDVVANRLRAGLLSADPAAQVRGAIYGNRFRDVAPALLDAIPEDERARAQILHEFAALGLPPERAVELTDKKFKEKKQAAVPTGGNAGATAQPPVSSAAPIGDERQGGPADDPTTPPIIGPGGEGLPSEKPKNGKSTDTVKVPQTKSPSPIFRKDQVDNDLAVDIALDFPTDQLAKNRTGKNKASNIGGYILDQHAVKRFAEVMGVTPESAPELRKKIAQDENLDAVQKGELVREIQRTLKGDPISKDSEREILRDRIGSLLEKLDARNVRARSLGELIASGLGPDLGGRALRKPKDFAEKFRKTLPETFAEMLGEAAKLAPGNSQPKNRSSGNDTN